MYTSIKVRFNLTGTIINRKFRNSKKAFGTKQLVCIISFYPPSKITFFPDGSKWVKQEDNHPGYRSYGWGDIGLPKERREQLMSKGKTYGQFKINAAGELIHYQRIKLNTGIYIFPECWDIKKQEVIPPYQNLNQKIYTIKHSIKILFEEERVKTTFSIDSFREKIIHCLEFGPPKEFLFKLDKSYDSVALFKEADKTIKRFQGIEMPDENNVYNVPIDLRDFIIYYHKNRSDTRKLARGTIEKHLQLKRKLQRWYDATGNILTITKTRIKEINEFLSWVVNDNETNTIYKNQDNIVKSKLDNNIIGVGTLNGIKKRIKYFYNRAVEDYSCQILFNTKSEKLREHKYDREDADVFLSMSQLQEIINLNLEEGSRIYKHRTLFVLGCMGGGYRISDLLKLPKPIASFSENKRNKNKQKYYSFLVRSLKTKVKTQNPIPSFINKFIEEYDFEQPVKDYEFRADIKLLGKLCGWDGDYLYEEEHADGNFQLIKKPFYQMLCPRTCRKTYCSLLYNHWHLPIPECMEFSGHKTEHEFKKYLKIDFDAKSKKLWDKMEE